MAELLAQLGVDWKLLAGQAVNFALVLTVLTVFLYRPLLRIMRERREKIAAGVKGGEEAERRLKEIEAAREYTLAEASKEGAALVRAAEARADAKEGEILNDAQSKAAIILREAEARASRERLEERGEFYQEAKALLRAALAKAVAERPDAVDDKLVAEAERALKRSLPAGRRGLA